MRSSLNDPLQVCLQAHTCRYTVLTVQWKKICTPDVQIIMQDALAQQQTQRAMMAGMGHYLPPPAAFPLMLVGQHCFGAGFTPNGHIPLLMQLVCGHTLQGSSPASQDALIASSVSHDWGATLELSAPRHPDSQTNVTINSNALRLLPLPLRQQ